MASIAQKVSASIYPSIVSTTDSAASIATSAAPTPSAPGIDDDVVGPQRTIIIVSQPLGQDEVVALTQHGTVVNLDPNDLPPFSIPLTTIMTPSHQSPACFLVIDLSQVTIRHWAQLRIDQIVAFPHVCRRQSAETDNEAWIAPFLPCSIVKQIKSAFTLQDFIAQLFNYKHIAAPESTAHRWFTSLFTCFKDHSSDIAAAATTVKQIVAMV